MTVKKKIIQTKKRTLKRFSVSQITTYMNCGRKYRYQYIDRIKTERKESFIIGDAHHKYFEKILLRRMKSKDPTPSQMSEIKEEVKQNMVKEMTEATASMDISTNKKIFDALTAKWEKEILPGLDPIGVEEEFIYSINDSEFIMYLDLINKYNGSKEVIDWKTVNKVKSKFIVDNMFQLSFYSLATGINNIGVCSLVKNLKNPKVQMERTKRSKADQEWCRGVIVEIMHGIDSSYFPRCNTENFLCSKDYCDFWSYCRGKHNAKYEKKLSWKR